ncbi:MAG: MATE family efflux transporter [Acholeplasmataceae bacterium]|jgi:putative MATE family efflux protein|nr:MATE family efflux transporter [Acholeplasmataceae bacterium]
MKAKRTFKSLFWPTFIELLFFMLMGTIDTFMLSHYSDFAVGAVGNANTLIQMFGVLLLVVANGVAVLVSQYIGAKRSQEAQKIIGSGMIINAVIGFILAISLFFLSGVLLDVVNTKQVLFNDSNVYLKIIAISLFFVAMSNVVTASLRSYGFAKYITYVVMAGNVLNIIGNYFLINGHWFFPRLGVYGAALSTLVVRILMMLVYLFLLIKVIKFSFKNLKIHKESSKNILRIGLPSAAESWTYTLMQGIILSIINGFGAEFTTARTYINTILTYIYIFSLAFASANAVMTGYSIGERDYEKAHKETMKTAFRSLLVVLAMTLIVNLSSGVILNFFSSNEVIINTARRILWIAIILEVGRSFNLILIQALRSAGDTTFPLIMAVLSMFGVAIPIAYILGVSLHIGLLGVYIAYTVDELLRASFMYIRWQSRKWENKSGYLEKTAS